MLNRLIAPFCKNHTVAPITPNRSNVNKKGVSRIFTLFVIVVMLAQVLFIGPVRKADAKTKPSIADTSSPAEPFIVNTPPTYAATVISGISSLLGFVTPTTAKKESPKTEEVAVEPPSPATAQPVPFMSSATPADLAALRLDPKNATGGTDLYSRNFGWGTSLVGLPGRAGMDAGFGISYNSLVWIKDTTNSEIIFDPELSNVSPGFQMGFPEIEPIYNTGGDNYSFLMVNPDGSRTEFRRVGTTDVFDSADSSYRRLVITTGTLTGKPGTIEITVTSTDGTMMHYLWKSHVQKYQCEEIKDRNGNFINVNYTSGRLSSVEDTLGRTITINRDGGGYPTSITQTWKDTNGSGSNTTHTWATFSYTNATVSTSFSGLTVIGPANSTTVKALEKITYPDSSFTKFEYNGYIQVKKISQVAADSTSHILNYVTTDLASVSGSQTDCPRFGETKTWVENFNGGSEVVVTNSLTTSATYSLPNSITGSATRIDVAMTGHPDGLYTRTYVGASGYKEGLTLATEDCTGSNCATRLRWTWTDWTQDNTGVSYITNPRVVESRVGDGTNIKKTTVGYGSNGYGLPEEVKVYDSDLSTVLKTQTTTYELGSTYTNRRIIGLPSETKLWEGTTSGTLMSKVTYAYDYDDDFAVSGMGQNNTGAFGHDDTNFGATFSAGRGNLTSVKRWDATDPTDSADAVTSTMLYNITGAVVAKTDPLSHTVKIDYTDNFNSSPGVTTYAYPKRVYDPAGNYSEIKYRYDIGANVEATSPAPAGQTYGKKSKRLFDSIGRLDRQSIYVNTTEKAYTRYEYPTNGIQSKSYTPVIDVDGDTNIAEDEVYSESWFDGAGRVRGSRTEHPGSSGGWTATQTEYNVLGQVYRTSVPTEVSVSSPYDPSTWTAAGDDYTRGWIWNKSYYDWKGRTIRTVPSDSTGSDGKDTLISYAGCGCAGGMVTTIEGPSVPRDDTSGSARRKQMVYADILGRNVKTEVYQWDGSTVDTTTVNTFNGRDQVTNTRQYAGTTSATTYQDVTMTYDGHGRMKTRHYPIEDSGEATTWNYNLDDSISQVIDPRGAITDFTYNSRGLATQIAYTPFYGGIDAPTVDLTYDNLGNRTGMDTAGVNNTTYTYDELSRMTGETVDFDDLSTNYSVGYTYDLSGGLKSITDPFGEDINYTSDKAGRLSAVTGDAWAQNTTGNYASNIKYRAFGSLKQMNYDLPSSNTAAIKIEYDNRLRASHAEATMPGSTTTFMMKADYSYLADGRTAAKDDLLDNAWDRTMKYDHGGRLTFNQFGMGAASGGGSTRVYEQTIAYDAFSQITSRDMVHWSNDGGFTASYVNGRKQDTTLTFDEAGNITAENHATNEFQNNTYDASGRRAAHLQRWHTNNGPGATFIVWENKTEQVVDGDGRSVIEKRGQRQINVSSPPSMTTGAYMYQVWSSVLGQPLTSILPDGNKFETNVFAGGAIIAKQKRFVDNSTNYDSIDWTVGDPVTGTLGKYMYASAGSSTFTEEEEPLGQKIHANDPGDVEPSSYTAYMGSADDPEWQCQAAKSRGSTFNDSPFHCGNKLLYNAGPELPWEDETSIEHVAQAGSHDATPVNNKTGQPTAKAQPEESQNQAVLPSSIPLITVPDSGDVDFENRIVTVRSGGPSLPDDFQDASNAGEQNDRLVSQAISDVKGIFAGDTECSRFFEQAMPIATIHAASNPPGGKFVPLYDAGIVAEALGKQLKVGFIPGKTDNTQIGIEMYASKEGGVFNTNGALTYFEFERAIVNVRGPFIATGKFGDYSGSAGRALAILHEIAHMIVAGRTKDGKGRTVPTYLIAPDGGEEKKDLSLANTKLIQDLCMPELDALK